MKYISINEQYTKYFTVEIINELLSMGFYINNVNTAVGKSFDKDGNEINIYVTSMVINGCDKNNEYINDIIKRLNSFYRMKHTFICS